MKSVYRADIQTHIFVSSDTVADDYVLKANETFENPSGKLAPAKLTGTSWIDATAEEHEAYIKQRQEEYLALAQYPAPVQQPDKGDQALNMLGQTIAQMQQQQTTLMQSVNALGQMIAKASVPSATQPENTADKQA